jgi:hypothetical protein
MQGTRRALLPATATLTSLMQNVYLNAESCVHAGQEAWLTASRKEPAANVHVDAGLTNVCLWNTAACTPSQGRKQLYSMLPSLAELLLLLLLLLLLVLQRPRRRCQHSRLASLS